MQGFIERDLLEPFQRFLVESAVASSSRFAQAVGAAKAAEYARDNNLSSAVMQPCLWGLRCLRPLQLGVTVINTPTSFCRILATSRQEVSGWSLFMKMLKSSSCCRMFSSSSDRGLPISHPFWTSSHAFCSSDHCFDRTRAPAFWGNLFPSQSMIATVNLSKAHANLPVQLLPILFKICL